MEYKGEGGEGRGRLRLTRKDHLLRDLMQQQQREIQTVTKEWQSLETCRKNIDGAILKNKFIILRIHIIYLFLTKVRTVSNRQGFFTFDLWPEHTAFGP